MGLGIAAFGVRLSDEVRCSASPSVGYSTEMLAFAWATTGRDARATSATVLDDRVVVVQRRVAEHTQLEAVLPARFPVAASAVAIRLGEDGNDLLFKRNRRRLN